MTNPPHWTVSEDPPGWSLEASIEAFDKQIDMPHGIKHRADMARYEKIIQKTKPDLLIECGTWHGGSARWFAERIPRVFTIDLDNDNSDDGRIAFWKMDSGRYNGARSLNIFSKHLKRMVSLDSDHRAEHVAKELEIWAPLVTPGCYLVVEDTLLHYRPSTDPQFYDLDPLIAVWDFLKTEQGSRFVLDTEIEAMHPVTMNPGGWLKAIR